MQPAACVEKDDCTKDSFGKLESGAKREDALVVKVFKPTQRPRRSQLDVFR
jgi:hypothetical protein